MPASVCEPVSSALRVSLAGSGVGEEGEGGLDGRLLGAARGALLAEIEFEAAGDYQSSVLDSLKSKYVVIRPRPPPGKLGAVSCSSSSSSEHSKNGEAGLPRATRVLFPLESVVLGWTRARGVGPWCVGSGMQNVGNTCYLNSTLQALYHVPAFANWLVSDAHHPNECRQSEGCVICGMRATLMATQKGGGAPIKPWQVYSKLRLICRHLTPGRQEDAHEFLRYLVEAMEKCYLSRCPGADKLDQYSKESTPLNQILGGYLRSTVRCLACHHLSTTYQHFQDLLLDIRKHSTLEEALDSFFSRERLEDLGYKCEACNKKVSATKQFFIERAPMVLCIALKRFSLAGGKLSKHIQFRKKILLNKYTHRPGSQPLSYRLVGMVTHLGPSQNCGHYTAIGQAPNGNFYQFDDSCVRPLLLSAVLGTNAYIMFYEKENGIPEETVVSHATASTSNAVYGPQLPDSLNRDKSPLKMTFKPFSFVNSTETKSREDKPPIILNSTLSKSNENGSNAEPWVVKQNGEIEKVTKVTNGTHDATKHNFVMKGSKLVTHENGNGIGKTLEQKAVSNGSLKSPEKKAESPAKVSKAEVNGTTSLVPYEDSWSGEERGGASEAERPSRGERLVVTTKATQHVWTVSNESSRPLLSPSLNGVVNNKIKEKDSMHRSEENGKSPNTSTSTMSSPSDPGAADTPSQRCAAPVPPTQANTGADLMGRHDTLNKLQHMSHRGYGAPVPTWTGTQATMGRQVYEERREERKRVHEGADEMDAGRNKKVKRFNNRYHQPYHRQHYNPFQEKQNKQQWGGGGGFKYHGGGGGGGGGNRYHYHNKYYNNKYKRFNRYNNGHPYRHH